MIEARDISVHVKDARLLADVSLCVTPGEIVALVGPNGAGKSTLLATIAGDIAPTAGTVSMAGRLLATTSVLERARVRAVLRQQTALEFDFSVNDVVLLGRTAFAQQAAAAADHAIMRAALHLCGLEHLSGRAYLTLSGGERQRVQLARVLAQIWDPPQGSARYLLLDEPTASLDLHEQHRVLDLARDLARQNTAVLAVVHDLNLAAQYADRVVVMRQGRIIATGAPHGVLTADTVRDAFNVTVCVTSHPNRRGPLIVPIEARDETSNPLTGGSMATEAHPSISHVAPTMERTDVDPSPGLATMLREGTTAAHTDAENAPLVKALLKGELGRASYATMLARLFHVYEALEQSLDHYVHHAVVGPLVRPQLWRSEALIEDLRFFLGNDWERGSGWSPATSRYVDRIRTLAGVDPTLLVAHAYTRYLGDLSGGQVMAKAVKKHLDVKGPGGVAFFAFPAIANIPEFKSDYRRCLDALPLDAVDKRRVVEEACRVFRLNRALADELWSERG